MNRPLDRIPPFVAQRRGRAARLATIAGLTAALTVSASAQLCAPSWSTGYSQLGGLSGIANCAVVFDPDGPGPLSSSPVIGGTMGVVYGSPSGTNWTPLGTGLNGTVERLVVHDFGTPGAPAVELVAAGAFAASGFTTLPLARWNGASWTLFGAELLPATGLTPRVRALLSWDPDGPGPAPAELFVGGDFIATTTPPAFGLARFNGTWSPLVPSGFGGVPQGTVVTALAVWDDDGPGPNPPALVSAGTNSFYGATYGVARFGPVTWSFLGPPFDAEISTLTVWDEDGTGPQPPTLYAGGRFTLIGGQPAAAMMRWNGAAWSTLGSGLATTTPFWLPGATPLGLTAVPFDLDGPGPLPERLIIGGRFDSAGGVTVSDLAAWNGSSWTALGGGVTGGAFAYGQVNALLSFDPDGGGQAIPRLYAAGDFTVADGRTVVNVARWNSPWEPTGRGLVSPATGLASYDPDGAGPQPAQLFVGTGPYGAGVPSTTILATWSGSRFAALPAVPNSTFYSLITADLDGPGPLPTELIAGGPFTAVGTLPAAGVAAWNGTSWRALSLSGLTPFALTTYDEDGPGGAPPALVAAANSASAAGTIERWNGASWTPVGANTISGNVTALAEFDEDGIGPATPSLFAAGPVTSITGIPVNQIARWNGYYWWTVGSGLSGGVPSVLHTYDPDGPGPLPPILVVGGNFTLAGGMPALGLAAWNGTSWSAPFGPVLAAGGGVGTIAALATVDLDGNPATPDELVAAGLFVSIGGVSAASIAHWNGSSWSPFGSGLTGGTSGVASLATFDEDGSGSMPPALYVSGGFLDAGGQPSPFLARWGVPAAPQLSFTRSGPGSPLLITDAACVPGASWFNAFSLDGNNALLPGSGPWFGLHIAFNDLVFQFASNTTPLVGVIGPGGTSQSMVPAATLFPLSGVTLWGLGVLYDPSTLNVFGASAPVSIGL